MSASEEGYSPSIASVQTTARCESLLKWVNTFEGIHCGTFGDLASGQVLLDCLHMVMPDVEVTNSKEPWKDLFAIFEEFCGCSLKKAVCAEEASSGNEEHIARVVVLLLAVAVQSKANEKIISDITSLEYEAQRDLMFFIETTLAKVKSHAIMAGTFTSGIGERLPILDTFDSVPVSSPKQAEPSTPISGCRDTDDSVFAFPTPYRPSRTICPTNFYNGLDSQAGAKLLMSPAITGRKPVLNRPLFGDPSQASKNSETEEISRMKHSLRVLEGTLQVEKKLAQEYYTELCTKIQEHEDLKKDYYKLERKLDCLQDMADLQDELAHTASSLAVAEKSIVTYKSKIQSLEQYKEKAHGLESKLDVLRSEVASCEEYKMSMKKMEASLLEKSSALKHVELQLTTTTIQLETKSAYMEGLLEDNRETQKRFNDARRETLQLESSVKDLERRMSERQGAELREMEEKREMSREIQQLQEALDASRKEVLDLAANQRVCKTSLAASEQEKTELHSELAAKISELTSTNLEVHSLQGTITDLTAEVARLRPVESAMKELDSEVTLLQSTVKTQEKAKAMEVAKLQRELAEKTSMLNSKELEMGSLKSSNEELESRLSQLRSNVETLQQERKASTEIFESRTTQLEYVVQTLHREKETFTVEVESKQRDELTSMKAELASKYLEIRSLTSSLERSHGAKDAEVESLKTELEAEAAKHSKALEQATTNMEAKLKSWEAKILSLESSKRKLEEELSQVQSNHETLDDSLVSASARLADSDERISFLVALRDKLAADAEVIQKEWSACKVKCSTVESTVLLKEKMLATSQDENSALQSKVSHLTELVGELQSSVQVANDQAACLATQKAGIEGECSRLEAKLEKEAQTNKSQETVIASYKRKLDASEQCIDTLKEQASSHESGQNQMVREMTRTNQLLQSEQANLLKRLNGYEEKVGQLSTRRGELEAALAAERAAKHQLTLKQAELKNSLAAEKAKSHQLMASVAAKQATTAPQVVVMEEEESLASPWVPLQEVVQEEEEEEDEYSISAASSAPNQPLKCQNKQEEEMRMESVVDEKARLKELRRRNKQALPHLKSSYPIEMQTKPDTPTNSDERLKHGSKKATSSKQKSQQPGPEICTPSGDILQEGAVATRTRSGGIAQGRVAPRQLSAPSTPQTPAVDYRRKQQNICQTTSLNLRGFLDETAPEVPSSIAFNVIVSPPKAAPPKRLQRKVKRDTDSDPVRRETSLKKAAVGSSSKPRGTGLGKKRVLRNK